MGERRSFRVLGPALAGVAAAVLAALGPATDVAAAEAAGAVPAAAPRAADDPATVTVMARNLYLGADVGVALELLPDLPAAAQFMWDQVAANDFGARVRLLAAEAAEAQPDLIGLQEATVWSCRPGPFSAAEPVYDFTGQFLEATEAAGVGYRVAEHDGVQASNPGYEIPAIPFLTRVEDPETFQPLFGSDTADCGFTISDALLVREDLADDVLQAGTAEYDERHAVAPVVFTVDRGYAWADVAIAGTTVRAVTTHLESLWSADAVPASARQAQQLVDDLEATTIPLIVVGDFNSDPRDPRRPGDPNPGGQPEAGAGCPAQPDEPTAATADPACSAYWTMVDAGYDDAGPNALDPDYRTWGTAGDLAGPDPERLEAALDQGNKAGFTDRLDYVFTRNGAQVSRAQVVGNRWPDGETWDCGAPGQIATTEASSAILARESLARPITGRGVCLPTDHAGLLVVLDVSAAAAGSVGDQPAPPDHGSLRVGLLGWLLILLAFALAMLLLAAWAGYRLATRGRRRG
jgi:endonuclease/exonuclease/phosphatase family metal-dependent hydrolase